MNECTLEGNDNNSDDDDDDTRWQLNITAEFKKIFQFSGCLRFTIYCEVILKQFTSSSLYKTHSFIPVGINTKVSRKTKQTDFVQLNHGVSQPENDGCCNLKCGRPLRSLMTAFGVRQ